MMMMWSLFFLFRLGFCAGQSPPTGVNVIYGPTLTFKWETIPKQFSKNGWNITKINQSTLYLEIKALNYTLQSWRCCGSNTKLIYFHGYIKNEIPFSAILLKTLSHPDALMKTYSFSCKRTNDTSGYKYIAIKKNLSQSAAQDYCFYNLTKFNVDGKLASFHSDFDLTNIRDLINTIENNGENKTYMYWTGLKFENNTMQYNFSDGTDASFACSKNIAGEGECVSVENRTYLKRSECPETKYFICKITNRSSQGIIIKYIFQPLLYS